MSDQWFDDYAESEDELQIDEYDITATPNDFNVSTLFNFIRIRGRSHTWLSTKFRLGPSSFVQARRVFNFGHPRPPTVSV